MVIARLDPSRMDTTFLCLVIVKCLVCFLFCQYRDIDKPLSSSTKINQVFFFYRHLGKLGCNAPASLHINSEGGALFLFFLFSFIFFFLIFDWF